MTTTQPLWKTATLGLLALQVSTAAHADSCAHATLSSLTKAELMARQSAEAGNAACLARVSQWVNGGVTRLSEDIDGDGKAEPIVLLDARPTTKRDEQCEEKLEGCLLVLTVGNREASIPAQWMKDAYFGLVEISVIDINKKDGKKEVVVSQRIAYDEDPEKVHHIWPSGADKPVRIAATRYNMGALTVRGDGILRMKDSRCIEDAKWGGSTEILEVGFKLEGTTLKPAGSKVVETENGCPACPYVSVWREDSWVTRGEILRFMNKRQLKGWNSLRTMHKGGPLRIRLEERKREITFLDAIEVRSPTGVYRPRGCEQGMKEWCEVDRFSLRLQKGDSLELHFDLPADAEGPFVVWANGFYVPSID